MTAVVLVLVLSLLAAASSFKTMARPIGVKNMVKAKSSFSLSAEPVTAFKELSVPSGTGIALKDITSEVAAIVKQSGCEEGSSWEKQQQNISRIISSLLSLIFSFSGVVTVMSKHSTVSVTINEMEGRLVDDVRQFFMKLAPPYYPYLHNDLDYRVGPPDWPGGDEAWRAFRATQPVNTHSHLIAMMLGTSESIPISQSKMQIGTYQNIIILDADGQVGKSRTILVQVTGTKGNDYDNGVIRF